MNLGVSQTALSGVTSMNSTVDITVMGICGINPPSWPVTYLDDLV